MYKLAIAVVIGAGALLAVPAPAHAQQSRRASVTCSSYHGHYHSCALPYRGTARLVQQLSGSACVRGRSWGQRGNSSVWVSRGCRGVFAVRHRYYNDGDQRVGDNGGYDHGGINPQGGWQRDRNYAVECRSNGRRTTCAWDPRYGNPYLMQRTSGECVEGRDWGYDSHGQIWVDRDCDARFGYH